jgi:hypothetical protein
MEAAMTRDPEVQALLDKQAIREVMVRYFRGLDRGDPAMIASTYHPDAVADHGDRSFRGATIGGETLEWMRRKMNIVSGIHYVVNQTIHLDCDVAGSETYFFVLMLESNEGKDQTLQTTGRFLDRLERRNGEWKIVHRVIAPEAVGYIPPDLRWLGPRLSYDGTDATDPSYALLS